MTNTTTDSNTFISLTKASNISTLNYNNLIANLGTYHTTNALHTSIANYYVSAQIDSKLSALIGSAPAVLDTIQELATALNSDSNYATTITTALRPTGGQGSA